MKDAESQAAFWSQVGKGLTYQQHTADEDAKMAHLLLHELA